MEAACGIHTSKRWSTIQIECKEERSKYLVRWTKVDFHSAIQAHQFIQL